MAAEEAASGISSWMIPAIIAGFFTLVGTIVAYLLTRRRDKQQKKEERIQAALINHFNAEMTAGLSHIGRRSGLKIMPNRNNELVFDSEDVQFSPIERSFPLEDEKQEAFMTHFPNIAGKWEELNNRALKLWEDNRNNRLDEDEFKKVSSSLKELSNKAKSTLGHIRKNHRIGTKDFNYNKKCPICREHIS